MKVLFIRKNLNKSGAPKILIWLAEELMNYNFETTLLSIEPLPSERLLVDTAKKSLNIKYSSIWLKRNTIDMIKATKRIRKLIKQEKYDLIISFGDSFDIILLLLKRFINIKIFVAERVDPYTNKGFRDKLRRKIFLYSDGMIFQTSRAQNYYSSKLKKPNTVIPNPAFLAHYNEVNIEKSTFENRGPIQKRIVSVARLSKHQKRQDLLIYAFSQITSNDSEATLHFYGEGESREEFIRLANYLNINEKVFFHGTVNNIISEISKATVFVLTSDYEGIPNSLLEAMSIGLPVISTDCSPGGARLLINHKVNGLLIERDNIQELKESIEFLLSNPSYAQKLGDEARKVKETFAPEKLIKQWVKFIHENI